MKYWWSILVKLNYHGGRLFDSKAKEFSYYVPILQLSNNWHVSWTAFRSAPRRACACPPQRKFTLVASVRNGGSEDLTEVEFYPKFSLMNANILESKNNYYCYYYYLMPSYTMLWTVLSTYIILLNHHEDPFNTYYTSRERKYDDSIL